MVQQQQESASAVKAAVGQNCRTASQLIVFFLEPIISEQGIEQFLYNSSILMIYRNPYESSMVISFQYWKQMSNTGNFRLPPCRHRSLSSRCAGMFLILETNVHYWTYLSSNGLFSSCAPGMILSFQFQGHHISIGDFTQLLIAAPFAPADLTRLPGSVSPGRSEWRQWWLERFCLGPRPIHSSP